LKLLNINGVAKLKASNYKGPLLDPKIVSEWTAAHVASNDTKLSAAVVESLGNFLPADKYLRVNVKLDSGVFVGTCYIFITRLKGKNDRTLNVLLISSDAICYLNDKLEPVPVTKSDTKDPKPSAIAIVLDTLPFAEALRILLEAVF
jgi:hypothetical protein